MQKSSYTRCVVSTFFAEKKMNFRSCLGRRQSRLFLAYGLLFLALSCAAGSPGDADEESGNGNGSGKGHDSGRIDPIFELGDSLAVCGDGVLAQVEACDDGNQLGGDGCSANCLGVEQGFICPHAGLKCQPFARCGDGYVTFPEQCDDGARLGGDGCSVTCKVELGYKCPVDDRRVSACVRTICADGVIEGAETCEDGNAIPFDGCSSQCVAEPACTEDGCSSSCGDGLVIDEACDDGNNIDGDGCSADCEVEPGYTCTAACEMVDGACTVRIPVIFRDFDQSHSDFESSQCDTKGVVLNKVKDRLVAGKPSPTTPGVCWNTEAWYTSSSENVTVYGEMVLFDNGRGGFVNRWGKNGEPWTLYENVNWAANDFEDCEASGCIRCPWGPTAGCTADPVYLDGQPFFFPVDGIEGALDNGGSQARIGPMYAGESGGYPYEHELNGGEEILHNFAFTSEISYWFRYDASLDAGFDFTGDDDVWVFVNDKLALDLGGEHEPTNGSFRINGSTAPEFGLKDGKVYAIKVFHAERQTDGSTFRLTLSGFTTARSDCAAECGDGIIGFGEECDDGVNDGGHDECDPGCVLGTYCGDGIVQDSEYCDDGNNIDNDGCSSSCRDIVLR